MRTARATPRAAAAGVALLLALVCAATAHAEFSAVTSWGTAGTGDGQFTTPLGIASNGAGTIYVADAAATASRVQRFDGGGAFLGAFGGPGGGLSQFAGAGHVAADPFGSVYVTDRGNARVEKFAGDGTFVLTWGTRGTGDGQFQDPTGVAADSRGNIYVVDATSNRVQRFTSDGAYDIQWGSTGTAPGQFTSAQDVAVDVFGDVYVVDSAANRVQKFSADGVLLPESWGSTGTGEGQFNGPMGIATDGAGNVFVADTGNQRVQEFTPDGAFVTQFGGPGTAVGRFTNPVDVASDATGAVYAVDQANARVQKFAEPTPPLPPPEVGKSANLELVSGTVLFRAPGATSFVPLKGAQHIPIGSRVQAKGGVSKLTTASDTRGGQQTARFYAGQYVIRQRPAPIPVTELALAGGTFAGCLVKGAAGRAVRAGGVARAAGGLVARATAKARERASRPKRSKRVVRRLWGDGKGRFRTDGRDASAGVRGTKWLTEDRCDGTLVRVLRGRVEVRDLARKRTVIVTAGKSYLARRP